MGLGIFTKQVNDESNDRLNHFFTFLLLLACAVVTCKRQYLGSPISCWVPKEFTRAHREYAESVCWAMNTYHLAHGRPIPDRLEERRAEELTYYQWVAFLLLGQALMFQLPSLYWTSRLEARGLQLERALSLLSETDSRGCDSLSGRRARRRTASVVAGHLDETLDPGWGSEVGVPAWWLRAARSLASSQLCRAYLGAKLGYISVAVAQFFIINAYLTAGSRTVSYGFSLAVNLTLGRSWEESGYFPRVTYCDFLIRVPGQRRSYVKRLLWMRERSETVGPSKLDKSVSPDCVLLLALLESNAGPRPACEVCDELLLLMRERRRRLRLPTQIPLCHPADCGSDFLSTRQAEANEWESDDQV